MGAFHWQMSSAIKLLVLSGEILVAVRNVSLFVHQSSIESFRLTSETGRRRKVRCQLSSNSNITVCSACIQRRTPCTIQESLTSTTPAGRAKLDERLERVESLLGTLVENSSDVVNDRDLQISNTPEDIPELLTSRLTNGTDVHNTPVLALFDNALVSTSRTLDHRYIFNSRLVVWP
jgi:hypothetical protein